MSAVIAITPQDLGDGTSPTVDARELHAFLEVGKDFSTWINRRIKQYGFSEGADFVAFDPAPQNGGAGNRGRRIEYTISLDMAKELAMVERNEKGRQARRYFIECERQARTSVKGLWDQRLELEKRDATSFMWASFGSKLMLNRKQEIPAIRDERASLDAEMTPDLFPTLPQPKTTP